MTFQVEVSEAAEQDADVILEWLIAQHAGETGLRWFQAMHKGIDSLAEMPGRCPLAPESAVFPFEVRLTTHEGEPAP